MDGNPRISSHFPDPPRSHKYYNADLVMALLNYVLPKPLPSWITYVPDSRENELDTYIDHG